MTTINQTYRILTELDAEQEKINAKRILANEFIKMLEADIQRVKDAWEKYGVVNINASNIFFQSNTNDEYTSCYAKVDVKFSKPVSHTQMVNRMKLIGRDSNSFSLDTNYNFKKNRYDAPSETVSFDFFYKITK